MFTDGVETINIIVADSTNAPINLAIPFAGRWQGWRDARIDLITVNAVAPGYIATEMTRAMPEAAKEEFLRQVLINRPGTPDDIASAVMFLASDQASYITGQVLTVDGGLTV